MAEFWSTLGAICLILSSIPQVWLCYRLKSARGLSWGLLILWTMGEIFMLIASANFTLSLQLNYLFGLLCAAILLYYKVFPGDRRKD